MDAAWRLKAGFVAAVFLGAVVALWPTVDAALPTADSPLPEASALFPFARAGRAVASRLHCPAYIKDRVSFAIAPGLDLRGGLRLVYTVEVEEAIRDKRDHFADEMRQELATLLGFHSGEGRVTRDELAKLDEKVHVSQPETARHPPQVQGPGRHRRSSTTASRRSSSTELAETQGPADDEVTFKIRAEVESQIRERAVTQAKDTVNRRVDELGLREAAVTTRDEDIIVEVPGNDEQSFDEIKEIIRQTARLEFKMVDDAAATFFGPRHSRTEDLPDGRGHRARTRRTAPDGLDGTGHKKSAKTLYARMSCQPPKYPTETMSECLGRFKAWTTTLSVPDDHAIGFEPVTEPVRRGRSRCSSRRSAGARSTCYARAEVTGDYITDAQRRAGPAERLGQFYVALTFSPAGADRFEEVTGANVKRRFAIILDDLIDSAPVIKHEDRRRSREHHAWARATRRSSCTTRRSSSWCSAPARSRRRSAPSNESLIGPSLGEDAIAQGASRARSSASIARPPLHGPLLPRSRHRRRHRGALQPAPAARGPRDRSARTMTLPGIAGLALTIGMARRRERAHQRAHP